MGEATSTAFHGSSSSLRRLDLARWLVSLGADDGVVNAHGLSCYEGLDPDEPALECAYGPALARAAVGVLTAMSAASGGPLTRGAAKKMKTPAKTGASMTFICKKDGELYRLKKYLHVT